jgi:hypothetical protein
MNFIRATSQLRRDRKIPALSLLLSYPRVRVENSLGIIVNG